MRHFGYLSAAQVAALFERPPERFDRGSGTDLLSVALGATLYMPADRPSLVADITKQTAAGVTSVVVCLEDAIADEQVATAEDNLVEAFSALHARRARGAAAAVRPGARGRADPRARPAARAGGAPPRRHRPAEVHRAQRHRVPAHARGGRAGGGRLAAGDAGDRVRRRALRRDPGRRAHPPPRAAAPRPAAHPRGPHRRHRPVRALRPAALPGAVHLRHQGRLRADRRRRQRARPHRRHRVHRVRAGVGVLRRPRTDLQAAAAAVPVPPARRAAACAASWSPAPSTG